MFAQDVASKWVNNKHTTDITYISSDYTSAQNLQEDFRNKRIMLGVNSIPYPLDCNPRLLFFKMSFWVEVN